MVHARVSVRLATIALSLVATACGAASTHANASGTEEPSRDAGAAGAFDGAPFGKFHSRRFNLSFALPDGSGFRIDDHKSTWLVATHERTQSRLVARAWTEPTFRTPDQCYETATTWDATLPPIGEPASDEHGPLSRHLQLISDETPTLPSGLAAHVVVAVGIAALAADGGTSPVAPPTPTAPLAGGFVAAAASARRRCVVLVYRTGESGAVPAEVLVDRLVTIAHGTVPTLTLDDPFSVRRDAALPSER